MAKDINEWFQKRFTADGAVTQETLDRLVKAAMEKNEDAAELLKQLIQGGLLHIPAGGEKPVLGPGPQALAAPAPVAQGPAASKIKMSANKADVSPELQALQRQAEERAALERAAALEAAKQDEARKAAERQAAADARAQEAALVAAEVAPVAAPDTPPAQKAVKGRGRGRTPAQIAKGRPVTAQVLPGTAVAQQPPDMPPARGPAMTGMGRPNLAAALEGTGISMKAETLPGAAAAVADKGVKDQADAFRRLNISGMESKQRDARAAQVFGKKALNTVRGETRKQLVDVAVLAQELRRNIGAGLPQTPDAEAFLKAVDNLAENAKTTPLQNLADEIKNTRNRGFYRGSIRKSIVSVGAEPITGPQKKKLISLGIPEAALPTDKETASRLIDEKVKEGLAAKPVPPGFTKPTMAEVPEEARNLSRNAGKKSLDEAAAALSGEAAPAPAAATAPPAAPAAAAAATSGGSPLRLKTAEGKTYKELIDEDPAKYGKGHGKGRVIATKEQRANRTALAKSLETPDQESFKKAKAELFASDEKRFGKGRTITPAQRASRKSAETELMAKMFPGSAAGKPAATPGVPAAPAAPTTPAVAPKAAVAPAAPTVAPTAAPAAPKTTAKASALTSGAWKKGPGGAGRTATSARALKTRAGAMGIGRGAGMMSGLSPVMRVLGPLGALYGAYEIASAMRERSIGDADRQRIQNLEALSAVSGGVAQDQMMREQVRAMQQMVDLAGVQRLQSQREMQSQYNDAVLNELLRGQQASLQAIAMPSRPSIAEMMARM
jgi:hypothetical protein